MKRRRNMAGLAIVCLLAAMGAARGQERIDFARDIQPIFQAHCTRCHGGVRREAGLSLLSAPPAGTKPGQGATGDVDNAIIVAGRPQASELIRRVTAIDPDERMPAEAPPLSADEISKLRRWVAAGADWPGHWSLAPLVAVSPPQVRGGGWTQNAIDRFILAKLESLAAAPSREADRYTLIRRLSLDLLGLPPAPADADAFTADPSPDAYERLLDRLLASPHFGERWGRHWLDLARYADSDGYEVDKPRPDAWRWRDWVIAAVNQDLPLDQFTIEQFAGDLLPDHTPQQQLATAYHRQTLTNNEGGVDKEEYRFKAVLDRASNTAAVWLGLTLACAQCHDHPYDPCTQREFYALAAIFNNAEETEIELPDAAAEGRRQPKFRVLSERQSPRVTRLLKRGDFLQPGDEVAPGLPAAIPHSARPIPHMPTRLDLAHWLVDPANPLTPRVQANQIWLRLFGQGLVPTPDDFGARGERPAHPELLDWLAAELLIRGGSRKAMIRLIAQSAAYRQASRQRSELAASDPLNRLLARQNRVRVEGEIVRDLSLAAGGLVSTRIGGPSVYPPLGAEFVKITFRSELPWKASTGGDRYRRGMYTFFKRSVPYPDLMTFDCPDASTAAAQRPASNTPLQALTTLNSEMAIEAARGLARRMLDEPLTDDRQRVRFAFRTCLTRPPAERETARLLDLVARHRAWYRSHAGDAAALAGELASTTDAAEAAALVATANVIMNLDEFITRE